MIAFCSLPNELIQIIAKYLNYFRDIPIFRLAVFELGVTDIVFTYKDRVSIIENIKYGILVSRKTYWDDICVQMDEFNTDGVLCVHSLVRPNYKIYKVWSDPGHRLKIFEYTYNNYYEYRSYSSETDKVSHEIIKYGIGINFCTEILVNYFVDGNIQHYDITTNNWSNHITIENPSQTCHQVSLLIVSSQNLDLYQKYIWQDKILIHTCQYIRSAMDGRSWNFNTTNNFERTVYYKEGKRISSIFDYYRNKKRLCIIATGYEDRIINDIQASLGYDFYLDPEKKI